MTMGSDTGPPQQRPAHQICVKGFWLGRYEVTEAQYTAITQNNPSHYRGPNMPVERIDWDEAVAFAAALGRRPDGAQYRLPSEMEWEYACSAGGRHDQFCGDEVQHGSAWYKANSKGTTHPVGSWAPNGFGLYDMSGNVWEWTADCWHDSYQGAPSDGSAWGQEHCYQRVIRGGSWASEPSRLLSRYRNAQFQTGPIVFEQKYLGVDNTGFRLVRVP